MSRISNNSRINSAATNNNSYIAQLRRLKIQEEILSGNALKTYIDCIEKCVENKKFNNSEDMKSYISKLRNSYTSIKNLFEDIKIKTNIQETLEPTDLNDLKRDVLELDDKIKSLKQFLTNEIYLVKSEEVHLLEKNDERQIEERKLRVPSKIQSKCYNEIVPSPVRAMINAPLKCFEVHQFQEFMRNSPNRYGGWNEYNHSLFVQIWNKYNGNEDFTSKFYLDTESYRGFKDEALQKIPGVPPEDINSHSDWYSQYLHLKMCQQRALEKWKENKKKIKKPLRESKKLHNLRNSVLNESVPECEKESNKKRNVAKLQHVSTLMQPTKQWQNKRDGDQESSTFECSIENIPKLQVPQWRMNLKCEENLKL